jgi:Zn-dependent metalloprotease
MSETEMKKICGCCFITPPNVLKKLSASADQDVAAKAARTIRITNTLAAFRAQLNTGAPSPAALTHTGLRRQVFDCGATEDIPGDLKRAEQDLPTADPAVNQAFDNAGASWKFYKDIVNRESVDNAGKTLASSVHFSQGYDNAFWNGQQMVYGDGDGKIFKSFTNAIDALDRAKERLENDHRQPTQKQRQPATDRGRRRVWRYQAATDPPHWSDDGR